MVDKTYPQLSSLGTLTLGSEMKEYAGGFSQIVTGYKVFGAFWKKTGSSVSEGGYQRVALIFHLPPSLDIFFKHIHYFLMLKVTTLDSVYCEALSKISGD